MIVKRAHVSCIVRTMAWGFVYRMRVGAMQQMLLEMYGERTCRRNLVHTRVTRICNEFNTCGSGCVAGLGQQYGRTLRHSGCDVALPLMTHRASNLMLPGLLDSSAL